LSRRPDLTEKVKDEVVRDYLRGDKTIVIQMEYKIGPAEMYRILSARQVSLRTCGTARPGRKTRALIVDNRQLLPVSRPKCKQCGRDYDPGLRKDGQPLRNEPRCWICAGWATDYRVAREVYNPDGSKAMRNEGEPWRPGRKYSEERN